MDNYVPLKEQVEVILGPDPAPFENLISSLLSSSNDQRGHAALLFEFCKQAQPDSLFLKLAHLLQHFPHPGARAMSAVILRELLTRCNVYLWPLLSPSTQSSLKSILLTSVEHEQTKSILKKLCDTVSELASRILRENGWPELVELMFQWVSSDSPKLRESAFLIFAQLSQNIGDTLIPFITRLHAVLLQCLGAPNFDVKIAALNAVINFIQYLDSSADRDQFQDLFPAMMTTLTEALNNGNEATAQEALKLLIELAGTVPRFFRRQLVDVVGSMLQIAEAEGSEEGTRHLAIEFVITLAEARGTAPDTMELPQFISRLFAILMRMLLDIEDDPDEDRGETSNYSVGKECLDRLAISLGGNTIFPVASEQLPAFMAASEWQKRHAVPIALTQIAEGCAEAMINNVKEVVSMLLNSLHDPHPRVRWAAINASRHLSTDFDPYLRILRSETQLMATDETQLTATDDYRCPRVQESDHPVLYNIIESDHLVLYDAIESDRPVFYDIMIEH